MPGELECGLAARGRGGAAADDRELRQRQHGKLAFHKQCNRCAFCRRELRGIAGVIGREQGWLGQSLYQKLAMDKLEGAPPPVDLADEIKAGRLVRTLIREHSVSSAGQGRSPSSTGLRLGAVSAVHDCSDGGLLVAIAEMALAGGEQGEGMGVELFPYEGRLPAHAIWFGEDQGRYVLSVEPERAEEVLERSRLLALPARIVGKVGGEAIAKKGETPLPLAELRTAHEGWMPGYMGGIDCWSDFPGTSLTAITSGHTLAS